MTMFAAANNKLCRKKSNKNALLLSLIIYMNLKNKSLCMYSRPRNLKSHAKQLEINQKLSSPFPHKKKLN
jgi:hypothetical protein